MWILKWLGADTYYQVVRASPYFAHTVLVTIGDWHFLKVGEKLTGQKQAKLALLLYMSNSFFN